MVVEGIEQAQPAPGVLEALAAAEAILVAPSNPYVSIGPILAVREIREALESRAVRSVAVSPLVGGKAVKGPADRMLSRMAGGTSPGHVASCYDGLIDVLVIDRSDAPADASVELVATDTLMTRARRDAAPRRDGVGGRVRVAVVGGTGPFGKALATRLREAGIDVVIGSRDADRAAAVAAELEVSGAANADAVRDVDLVVLATNADAALDTARSLRSDDRRDARALRRVRARVHEGGRAADDGCTVARGAPPGWSSTARSSRGCTPSRRRRLGKEHAPDEDALVCGDDGEAKALALELAERIVAGHARDAGPLRAHARSRGSRRSS